MSQKSLFQKCKTLLGLKRENILLSQVLMPVVKVNLQRSSGKTPKASPHIGTMFWAVHDIPPADKGPELFSSKKKRNIPTGKMATATNLPFNLVGLESTSKEGLNRYRASIGIQNSLLRRIEEEEKKTLIFNSLPTSPHLPIIARHCTASKTASNKARILKGKKTPTLWLLSSPRQAYRIKIWTCLGFNQSKNKKPS